MIKPEIPHNDQKRVNALNAYGITNTDPEPAYNDIAKLAQAICDAKVALVTFIDTDTQWFKAHEGTDIDRNSRELALCSHAINNPEEITYVSDTRKDERFSKNPMVTGPTNVIFYAGAPLINPNGYVLGTICVMDNEPKKLSPKQIQALKLLANQVIKLLELRKNNYALREHERELEEKNKELENFAAAVSHDIKSPLGNIGAITKMLMDHYTDQLDDKGKELIEYLNKSSTKVNKIVQGMLTYYKSSQFERQKSVVDLEKSIKDIVTINDEKNEFIVDIPDELPSIEINKAALELILSNLVTNAIKYNDKPETKLSFDFRENNKFYHFSVKDNGPGIDKKDFKKIFKHYTNLGKKDRNDSLGTGLGLALVKKILDDLGGKIQVESEIGKGSNFTFSLPK